MQSGRHGSDNPAFVRAGQLTNCERDVSVYCAVQTQKMTRVQLTIKAFGPWREKRGQSSPYYEMLSCDSLSYAVTTEGEFTF